ncbi:MAG: RnfABCDGE type electron transport complex subunit G [Bacteroidales bacterium]|nr:RnfABCDGE type electron transport complex subunit G [Bacteroidales bacterium]
MAKKAQSTLPNMVVSLTAIALVAAAILAALNAITKEPIEQAKTAKIKDAVGAVLPAFKNVEDRIVEGYTCHVATDSEGRVVGTAVEAGSDKGFGGHLQLMVGFDAEGKVCGYQVIETHETPGLGAKADQWFQKGGKGDIIGRSGELKVKKDGGDVDAISGSTITSRAFLGIVNEAAAIAAQCNQ